MLFIGESLPSSRRFETLGSSQKHGMEGSAEDSSL